MFSLKNLKKSIQGWIPQELKNPNWQQTKTTKSQTTKSITIGGLRLTAKDIPKAVLYVVCVISLNALLRLHNISWISLLIVGLLVFSMVAWGVSRVVSVKFHRRKYQRIFKYLLVGAMISTVIFSAFENYLFYNAGYPLTVDASQSGVTVSYPSILNVSISEEMQNIKNTPAFRLLSIEHPGEEVLWYLIIYTYANYTYANDYSRISDGGVIEACFAQSRYGFDVSKEYTFPFGSEVYYRFISKNGSPYSVHVRPLPNGLLPEYMLQQTNAEKSFHQIDSLGLQWFYEQAVTEYTNKNKVTPEITDLQIRISFGEFGTYQGFLLYIEGLYVNDECSDPVFSATFQSDGTLLKYA